MFKESKKIALVCWIFAVIGMCIVASTIVIPNNPGRAYPENSTPTPMLTPTPYAPLPMVDLFYDPDWPLWLYGSDVCSTSGSNGWALYGVGTLPPTTGNMSYELWTNDGLGLTHKPDHKMFTWNQGEPLGNWRWDQLYANPSQYIHSGFYFEVRFAYWRTVMIWGVPYPEVMKTLFWFDTPCDAPTKHRITYLPFNVLEGAGQ